jgi:Holliday junction resolvase RusA-like endonuclease
MISFFVEGIPAPGGSKKYVGHRGGRAIIVDMGGKRTKDWRSCVAKEGRKAMSGKPLMAGPLHVTMEFFMPRPKKHFKSNGELRPDAPYWHTNTPDALKLARSTEDALTGIVWEDDKQAAINYQFKTYTTMNKTGAQITIRMLVV